MFSIHIDGLDQVLDQLKRIGEDAKQETSDALYAEAELIMGEAKHRTPADTGALRSSGHVVPPDSPGDPIVLAFGGPAAPYAVYVHENLEAKHSVGQAKFLESAIIDALPDLVERVAKRVKL